MNFDFQYNNLCVCLLTYAAMFSLAFLFNVAMTIRARRRRARGKEAQGFNYSTWDCAFVAILWPLSLVGLLLSGVVAFASAVYGVFQSDASKRG